MPQPFYLAGERYESYVTMDVKFPYDQSYVETVCLAQPQHIEKAIVAANEALAETHQLEARQRAKILRYIADQMLGRMEQFSQLLVRENGKTIKEARMEMARCVSTFEIAAGETERLYGEYFEAGITGPAAGRHCITKLFPIGVVAGITPFNFPMNLMAHKVAPAIASGCPIIIKPASATPLTIMLFAKIVEESGRPLKAFSALPCDRTTGQQLVEDERIHLLSFTGSPHVGWKMKEQAGKKKVILELGGNAGLIIDKDVTDRDRVIKRAVIGSFYQAGQVCISVQRITVHKDIAEAFTTKFLAAIKQMRLGNPLDENTDIGGIIDENNIVRLQERIGEAIDKGADCLIGNAREGTILQPTVLTKVSKDSKIRNEEAFGPVVLIDTFTTFDEAITQINNSTFGLQVGVFSNNLSHVRKAFADIDVGGVIHNDVPSFRVDHMPYGGIKDSGLGREGVKYAIQDMTETKVLVLKP